MVAGCVEEVVVLHESIYMLSCSELNIHGRYKQVGVVTVYMIVIYH